ncbi:hypothetical protein CRM22_004085 [Opisthorchis felineus]|uniref:HMG box domain-containing protein n=1 Tax=Opisthorchis felineus TaxID=147828 RepID=A0A4S2M430_OPIFE|nr:hypothetical protein CRM22_004085 [Opisthorchis felineus]TGZ68738.1 hypothetical protein CRM22_004085 [Opisthorchis felineus]TGZ68739.1 hypothetical protein CRM22_004085 [Opisthorchis felineus]
MFTLSCPSLRKAIFDTMTLSRALLSTSPTLASPNTFHQFVKARYMEIKQKNPSLKTAELMRKVGEEYRKLTDAERVQFKLSEPTPDLIKRHSEKRKRLMYAHRHGMPRRPSFSGMNIFIREKLCDLKGQPIRKVSARFKEAVEEWKKLSSTEKALLSSAGSQIKLWLCWRPGNTLPLSEPQPSSTPRKTICSGEEAWWIQVEEMERLKNAINFLRLLYLIHSMGPRKPLVSETAKYHNGSLISTGSLGGILRRTTRMSHITLQLC